MAKPAVTPKLSELAARIAKEAAYLENYLDQHNLPHPSYDAGGPAQFPVPATATEASTARFALIDAAKDLRDLVVGPADTLKWISLNDHNLSAALHAVYHFKIAHAVPFTKPISFHDLSVATGVDELNLKRILRLCITERIFTSPTADTIAHSASSYLLASDKGIEAVVGHMLSGAATSATRMVDALEKFRGSEEPECSAWTLTLGKPFFEYMMERPETFERFAGCMTGWSGNANFEGHMVGGFDWAALGHGLVVDVGGNQGQISLALAKAFPNLRFQVQDLPFNAEPANAAIQAASLTERVEFVSHDFFKPLPESSRHASAYLLRYVLHDWSDTYARKILANIVAAMGSESRLVIADACLPPPGVVPRAQEKILRAFDMSMFVQLNARERAYEDWDALLKSVDQRLEIVDMRPPPPGVSVSILAVRLR